MPSIRGGGIAPTSNTPTARYAAGDPSGSRGMSTGYATLPSQYVQSLQQRGGDPGGGRPSRVGTTGTPASNTGSSYIDGYISREYPSRGAFSSDTPGLLSQTRAGMPPSSTEPRGARVRGAHGFTARPRAGDAATGNVVPATTRVGDGAARVSTSEHATRAPSTDAGEAADPHERECYARKISPARRLGAGGEGYYSARLPDCPPSRIPTTTSAAASPPRKAVVTHRTRPVPADGEGEVVEKRISDAVPTPASYPTSSSRAGAGALSSSSRLPDGDASFISMVPPSDVADDADADSVAPPSSTAPAAPQRNRDADTAAATPSRTVSWARAGGVHGTTAPPRTSYGSRYTAAGGTGVPSTRAWGTHARTDTHTPSPAEQAAPGYSSTREAAESTGAGFLPARAGISPVRRAPPQEGGWMPRCGEREPPRDGDVEGDGVGEDDASGGDGGDVLTEPSSLGAVSSRIPPPPSLRAPAPPVALSSVGSEASSVRQTQQQQQQQVPLPSQPSRTGTPLEAHLERTPTVTPSDAVPRSPTERHPPRSPSAGSYASGDELELDAPQPPPTRPTFQIPAALTPVAASGGGGGGVATPKAPTHTPMSPTLDVPPNSYHKPSAETAQPALTRPISQGSVSTAAPAGGLSIATPMTSSSAGYSGASRPALSAVAASAFTPPSAYPPPSSSGVGLVGQTTPPAVVSGVPLPQLSRGVAAELRVHRRPISPAPVPAPRVAVTAVSPTTRPSRLTLGGVSEDGSGGDIHLQKRALASAEASLRHEWGALNALRRSPRLDIPGVAETAAALPAPTPAPPPPHPVAVPIPVPHVIVVPRPVAVPVIEPLPPPLIAVHESPKCSPVREMPPLVAVPAPPSPSPSPPRVDNLIAAAAAAHAAAAGAAALSVEQEWVANLERAAAAQYLRQRMDIAALAAQRAVMLAAGVPSPTLTPPAVTSPSRIPHAQGHAHPHGVGGGAGCEPAHILQHYDHNHDLRGYQDHCSVAGDGGGDRVLFPPHPRTQYPAPGAGGISPAWERSRERRAVRTPADVRERDGQGHGHSPDSSGTTATRSATPSPARQPPRAQEQQRPVWEDASGAAAAAAAAASADEDALGVTSAPAAATPPTALEVMPRDVAAGAGAAVPAQPASKSSTLPSHPARGDPRGCARHTAVGAGVEGRDAVADAGAAAAPRPPSAAADTDPMGVRSRTGTPGGGDGVPGHQLCSAPSVPQSGSIPPAPSSADLSHTHIFQMPAVSQEGVHGISLSPTGDLTSMTGGSSPPVPVQSATLPPENATYQSTMSYHDDDDDDDDGGAAGGVNDHPQHPRTTEKHLKDTIDAANPAPRGTNVTSPSITVPWSSIGPTSFVSAAFGGDGAGGTRPPSTSPRDVDTELGVGMRFDSLPTVARPRTPSAALMQPVSVSAAGGAGGGDSTADLGLPARAFASPVGPASATQPHSRVSAAASAPSGIPVRVFFTPLHVLNGEDPAEFEEGLTGALLLPADAIKVASVNPAADMACVMIHSARSQRHATSLAKAFVAKCNARPRDALLEELSIVRAEAVPQPAPHPTYDVGRGNAEARGGGWGCGPPSPQKDPPASGGGARVRSMSSVADGDAAPAGAAVRVSYAGAGVDVDDNTKTSPTVSPRHGSRPSPRRMGPLRAGSIGDGGKSSPSPPSTAAAGAQAWPPRVSSAAVPAAGMGVGVVEARIPRAVPSAVAAGMDVATPYLERFKQMYFADGAGTGACTGGRRASCSGSGSAGTGAVTATPRVQGFRRGPSECSSHSSSSGSSSNSGATGRTATPPMPDVLPAAAPTTAVQHRLDPGPAAVPPPTHRSTTSNSAVTSTTTTIQPPRTRRGSDGAAAALSSATREKEKGGRQVASSPSPWYHGASGISVGSTSAAAASPFRAQNLPPAGRPPPGHRGVSETRSSRASTAAPAARAFPKADFVSTPELAVLKRAEALLR